ncbi:NAD-dependent epimerase/dehydratase family protein [Plantactinospora solaniradicis]|uniref:NAD-dependent epimerase/dehydratase family protein n=1 Tax=Plantactinospora solaniradicis TaxID=1723736 RepID=A0ABW1KM21_9ACTN
MTVATPRRVLVTGAAGLIGRAVVELLHSRGVPATALVLDDPGDLPVDRVVIGNAGDSDLVRGALRDVDAVAHLAAVPSPHGMPAIDVFAGNSRATFAVLEEAGRAGVPRMMIASSYSVLGLPWSPRRLHPDYYPIDERTPLQVEDPYGLSKQADEATATMISRRYGATVVAVRFPFVGDDRRLAERLTRTVADPGSAAMDSWAYLHVRDAAEVTWRALTEPLTGFQAPFVAAPKILAPYATEALIAAYHPHTPLRRRLPGREVPIDLRTGQRLLRFTAQHLVELDTIALPAKTS